MLSINGLEKTYPNGVKALNGIDLAIPKGLFGLLGPNGAGKSSLMRTLATLQDADKGTVTFDGINLLKDPLPLRRRLGYLPQEFGVYPRMTAYELLDHFARLKGLNQSKERKSTVENLLMHTNLYQHRKKAVANFSGGMRQRFGIAQALLGDPDLIIVDEPTAGLDPEERNRFHNLLVELGEQKVIILSTHIVEDVAELCRNMAIMAGGRVLTQGSPQQLIAGLEGKIWRKSVTLLEKAQLVEKYSVISSRLVAGKTQLHVIADQPPAGFEACQADLEDVYFATLAQVGAKGLA